MKLTQSSDSIQGRPQASGSPEVYMPTIMTYIINTHASCNLST